MVGGVPGAGDTGKSQTALESHSLVEELRCEMTASKTSSVARTQGPSGLGQRPRAAMAQKRGGQDRPQEEVVRKASWRRGGLSYTLKGGLKY